MTTYETVGFQIDDSARRREDIRFVTGQGRYTSDIRPDGLKHVVFVRSPYVHARVNSIDVTAARASPGVAAVFTHADLAAEGVATLPWNVAMKRPDGSPAPATRRPVLVGDLVRCVGEPVAMVAADSLAAALDAAELVQVDYADLPAVADARRALAPDAPKVWAAVPDNIAFRWSSGDFGAIDGVIAGADHTARLDFKVSRVTTNSIEPRMVLAEPNVDGKLKVTASNQGPHGLRDSIAHWLKVDPATVRVVCPDVGGSFGMKSGLYREDAAVAWAARKLGVPLRWVATRSEGLMTDDTARDVQVDAALALDAQGRFLALKVRCDLNLGAYLTGRSMGLIGNIGGMAGMYRIPAIAVEVYGILTNTNVTAPYRGAGRPEATYVIERLIDQAARELGLDRFALRHRNLVAASEMPFKTALTFTYDCGDFAAAMRDAESLAGITGFAARRAESEKRGLLRGLGLANPIEASSGPVVKPTKDYTRVTVAADGGVTVNAGVMSVGQGHETVFSDLAATRLGVPPERVAFLMGDTDLLAKGRGNGGSGGSGTSASALSLAIDDVVAKGRAIAAARLDATPDLVEFRDGRFLATGTNRGMSLAEVAAAAGGALVGNGEFLPAAVTFPNGTHICEVEIDPETGVVAVVSYACCEDLGTVMKPALVHGQVHGGVAQGVGQALKEELVYDEGGQLLSGTFMDYAMPLAADLPSMQVGLRSIPTRINPIGAKGVGEAGTVGGMAATMSAIMDALTPLGITHIDMPATPLKVWQAIQQARSGG